MRETTDTLSIRGRVNPKEHLSRAGLVTRVSRAPVRVREGVFSRSDHLWEMTGALSAIQKGNFPVKGTLSPSTAFSLS